MCIDGHIGAPGPVVRESRAAGPLGGSHLYRVHPACSVEQVVQCGQVCPGSFSCCAFCTAPTAFVQPAGPLWAALCSHCSAFMVFSTGAHGCYCLLGGMTMIMMSGTVPLTCDMIRFEKCFQSVCSACRTGFWALAASVNGHGVFARLSLHALLPNASPFGVWWL